MTYCFYDASGAIISLMRAPSRDMVDLQGKPYLECDETVSDTTHYVLEGAVVEKAPFACTQTISGTTITLEGLPAGTTVRTEGQEIVADDQPTEIAYEIPGTYTLELSGSVPHLDETLEVTVG